MMELIAPTGAWVIIVMQLINIYPAKPVEMLNYGKCGVVLY